MTRQTHIAVLTGDIVNSTELGEDAVKNAMQALANSAQVQNPWHGAPLHFSQHRGDGWQVVLHRPERALRSALAFHAAIRSLGKEYTTRIASSTAHTTGTIQPDLNQENQPAFIESGRLLEKMSKRENEAIIQTTDAGASAACFILAGHIAASWTPAQAQAMQHIIQPPQYIRSFTYIGKALGKSRQAVHKSIEGAGGFALHDALQSYEKGLRHD